MIANPQTVGDYRKAWEGLPDTAPVFLAYVDPPEDFHFSMGLAKVSQTNDEEGPAGLIELEVIDWEDEEDDVDGDGTDLDEEDDE